MHAHRCGGGGGGCQVWPWGAGLGAWALCAVLACWGRAWAAPASCHAWGDAVRLAGQLSLRTHAGPPNYDSVHRGDAREVVPVFKLQHKLCVQGEGERHQVAQVQLLDLSQALQGERLARCLKHCSLSGELQQAESGHHHLPVLLELADDPDETPMTAGRTRRAVR